MVRQIDIGNVLSRIFSIYGDQASVLLPVAAAIFLFEAVITALLVAASPVLVIVAVLVSLVAATLYAGMVVELVHDVQDGRRDHSVGELVNSVTGVIVPLILAGLIVGISVAIGLVLLIIPGLILLTLFAVVAPSVVVERKGVFEALSRSRELVRGNGLQVFGVIVVVFLLTFVVSALIGGIGAAAGTVGRIIAEFIASTITAPVAALASAVLFFELRGAKGEEPVAAAPAAAFPGESPEQPSEAERAFGEPGPPPENR